MIQQSRRPAVAEAAASVAVERPRPLEAGNRELLDAFGLAPERDESEERPWLDDPAFESGGMLAAMARARASEPR